MREFQSDKYPTLPQPVRVTDLDTLRIGDPGLYSAWQDLLAALGNDMLPAQAQLALVEAMPPSTQREVVNKIAGLDSSVLLTIKNQIQMVDNVLRNVIDENGRAQIGGERIDISPKEAINMSIKLTQMITRDLPRMYKVERVQRMEKALFQVVETMLTKEQQDAVLLLMQEQSLEDARRNEL